MKIRGRVRSVTLARGSKSEHRGVALVSGGRQLRLRRRGANPFVDPELRRWIGEDVECAGEMRGATFVVNEVRPMKRRKTGARSRGTGASARRARRRSGRSPARSDRAAGRDALRCEGIHVALKDDGQRGVRALRPAKALAIRFFGPGWRVSPVGEGVSEVVLTPIASRPPLRVAEAWDMARALERDPRVAWAEPALAGPGLEPPRLERALSEAELRGRRKTGAVRARAFVSGAPLACATDSTWSLDSANVKAAWQQFPGALGTGILVGHPDTGYTSHPEIWGGDAATRLLWVEGYDFLNADPDPVDDMVGGVLDFPGHGTATASVIMSGKGGVQAPAVSGVAPEASLVPLRVSTSVIHLSYTSLVGAIHFAVDHGHHVLSMSLGGPFGTHGLEQALERAVGEGLILLAAAGNYWPFVVWPAASEHVVAVAATNCRDEPWRHSSAGPEVDVAAPGESVWVARTVADHPLDFSVEQGSGTSFAVASVAGVAALWLTRHGRQNLIDTYGKANLARVFREMLVRDGVRTPPGWDTESFGAGIVDAAKLLAAPLPAAVPAVMAARKRMPAAPGARRLAEIARLFPDLDAAEVRVGVAALLRTPDAEMEDVLAEVGRELAVRLAIEPTERDRVRELARRRRGRRRPRARPRPPSGASKRLAARLG
jgi:serine protease